MTIPRLLLGCFVAATAFNAEQPGPTAPAPAYRVIGSNRTSTLEREANEAGAKGYRIVFGAKTNTAKTLVLRARGDGASSEYRVISTESYRGTDTELLPAELNALEQKLNAAAADGFQLMPQAFFRVPRKSSRHSSEMESPDALVAMMERRTLPPKTEYRLLAFTTVYEATLFGFKDRGTERLDTEDADGKLAGAARAGYRVAALLARDAPTGTGFGIRKLVRPTMRQQVVVVFEKASEPVSNPREAVGRYHLVATVESDLDEILNGAAAAGYHLLAAADEGYSVIAAIFERNAPDEPRRAYTAVIPRDIGPMSYRLPDFDVFAGSLATASKAGWLPHPRGLVGATYNKTPPLGYPLVIMEKSGAIGNDVRFVVLNEARSPSLEKGLNGAAAEGYELRAVGSLASQILAVLTRMN